MSTEEQARELLTQHRQHENHVKEVMVDRAEAAIDNPNGADSHTQEQARELLTQQRNHDEHLKETMLNRSKSDINLTNQ